jgi:hypothetical protein
MFGRQAVVAAARRAGQPSLLCYLVYEWLSMQKTVSTILNWEIKIKIETQHVLEDRQPTTGCALSAVCKVTSLTQSTDFKWHPISTYSLFSLPRQRKFKMKSIYLPVTGPHESCSLRVQLAAWASAAPTLL